MMRRSPRVRTFFGVVAFVLRTTLTLLAAGILVAEANGYHINFSTFEISKQGLLVARISPDSAQAMLSGEPLQWTSGQWVTKRPPGTYTLTVNASEYLPWHKLLRIEAGRSIAFPNLSLYRQTPTLVEERAATRAELDTPLVDPRLAIEGSELWLNRQTGRQLISRFSAGLHSASLLDAGHVIFLRDRSVHVIDVDGSNDQLLLSDISSPDTRVLARNGTQLGLLSSVGQIQWYTVQ